MTQPPPIAKFPSPLERPDADVVIYDGKCRFCQGQVKNLSKFDGGQRLAYVSLHDPFVARQFPDLRHDQLMQQMYVVPRSGDHFGDQRYGGAAAVRYLTRRLPMLWWLAPLLHIPFSLPFWQWAYNQIAKRRYRLAAKQGTACDPEGSCELHARK